jgi:tetratricopeptide (TPR) repeat protein
MNNWQRAGLIAALVVGAAAACVMYWSQHLTYKAMRVEDAAQRVGILKKAVAFWGWNDEAKYELGKAYFDYGYANLGNEGVGRENIGKSVRSHVRALRLNPANFYAHYDHAQSLFYMDHLMPGEGVDFLSEYKKAAMLTGHRNEVYYQVGKMFLSQWEDLLEEDRAFTTRLLKRVTGEGNLEQFQSLLHTWDMNVGDYAVMGQILPDNPQILRAYARFLGERSLDLGERQRVLAKAESLDFGFAKEQFTEGKNQLRYYRAARAEPHLTNCLRILDRIYLYQGVAGTSQIDVAEMTNMRMTAHQDLAKCGLMQRKTLKEVEEHLFAFLKLAERVADASELEGYLRDNSLLGRTLEESVNDLWLLDFHTLLYMKLNKYRDIKNIGGLLGKSFLVVPEEEKKHYVRVLGRVAESHLITGNFYDALEFYGKALEVDENDVGTLLGLRRNYDRLNEEREIRRIDERLSGLLTPREMDMGARVVAKRRPLVQTMVLDGSRVTLGIELSDGEGMQEGGAFPLICVIMNGRVVWENYVSGSVVSVVVEAEEEANTLEILPVNRAVTLERITWQ